MLTLPLPSLPAPVCLSFMNMFLWVKLHAGKSKLALLIDTSLGKSRAEIFVSRSSKWLPYMKMPRFEACPWMST